jgi:hypothetical protein
MSDPMTVDAQRSPLATEPNAAEVIHLYQVAGRSAAKPMPQLLAAVTALYGEIPELASHGSYVTVSHTGTVSIGFHAPDPTIEALRALVRVAQAMGAVITTHRNETGTTAVDGDFVHQGIPFVLYTTIPTGDSS